MLTILAPLLATLVVAGCGGKGGESKSKSTPGSTTTHKHKSKPAY
jgi:hypothetical protein